ncbi:MAG: phosphoenolpyruvate--protein phosphotransferase [Candidatus Omnitrophica bacterium]|nr:phosphoenolpyruvate--protein phosphotransferase [Candidatus Omnitrophota bacterium]
MMKKIKGIGISSGIAIGKAFVLEFPSLQETEYTIDKPAIEKEIERFNDAINMTESQIEELQQTFEKEVGPKYADIFSFHLAILKDKWFKNEVERIIREERINSESAVKKVIHHIGKIFKKEEKDFFQDRRRDIIDVIERIIHNLSGYSYTGMKLFSDEIIVTRDLSPSQTVSIDKNYIRGFVTAIGSETSHAAIIAKALEIPAVVAGEKVITEIKTGDTVIIDGQEGEVIIKPSEKIITEYKKKQEQLSIRKKQLLFLKDKPCETIDGRRIYLHANIELPEEVETARKYGADGIGLYRTEYLYLNRKDIPTEDEHFLAYKKVAEKMGSEKPVIIRTIDIGGDKFVSALSVRKELNPFLGWRGIRFSLERKDIFETQLRAILRAAIYGNLKVMFPMVSTMEEVKMSHRILQKVKDDLKKEKKKFREDIEVGIMVETPSAALITDKLAEESDFFSIGSNDLIQYTLAVDRSNEKISHLYQPCHPAVIKLIRHTIENGKKRGIWTGLCGEMASIPEIACLLVGMGIDELSMAPSAIPAVKEKIRSIKYSNMEKISQEVLLFETHEKVYKYLADRINGG